MAIFQVTFVQRPHSTEKGEDSRSSHRARPVRYAGGDQHGLCQEDEDFEENRAGRWIAQERGQICQHID